MLFIVECKSSVLCLLRHKYFVTWISIIQLSKMVIAVLMNRKKWDSIKSEKKNKKKHVKVSEFLLIVIRISAGRGRKKS